MKRCETYDSKKLLTKNDLFAVASGIFKLKRGNREFYQLPRDSVEELVMGSYVVNHKNSTRTYYSICLVIPPDIVNRIIAIFPDFVKCNKDYGGYRFYSNLDKQLVRSKIEEYSKLSNLPIRTLSGELRITGELDSPYFITMKDKIDLTSFPPFYKLGDAFEIKEVENGLEMILHKRMYIPPLLLTLVMALCSIFYIFAWLDGDFGTVNNVEWFWVVISHSPLIGLLYGIVISYFRVKNLKIRISQGILYIINQKIPLEEIEEINSEPFLIYFQSDKKSYSFRFSLYILPQNWTEFKELIKKMVVFQGKR